MENIGYEVSNSETSGKMKNYFRVPNEIFGFQLTPIEFYVLCYLIKCRNTTTGLCCPSKKNIAESCGLAVSSISKAIKNLSVKGIISVNEHYVNNTQKSNWYVIVSRGRGCHTDTE